jgi:hypothetical protein
MMTLFLTLIVVYWLGWREGKRDPIMEEIEYRRQWELRHRHDQT